MVDSDKHSPSGGRLSRRRFLRAVETTGIAAGIAGCTGGGGGGGGGDGDGDGTDTPIDTEAPEEEVTVGWAADSNFADNQQALNDALHNAGLPDNISVNFLAGSAITDNRRQKYQQWLSANRAEPAIMMMDSGWTVPFIARDQLLNLTKSLPSGLVDTVESDYFEASVNTARGANGDLYGVPLFPDFPTMQYRKDLVEDAGYDPEGENWATEGISWKRFSEVTAETKQQSGLEYGYSFQANIYEGLSCCDFNEFMTSWGGAYFGNPEKYLFGPVGDRPITVDEEPVLDAIRMVRTFIHGTGDEHALSGFTGGIAPEAVLQWTEESSRKPFTAGDVVMHRNWPYSININGADDKFGTDLGVMPIPWGVTPDDAKYPGTGGVVSSLGGWNLALNPSSEKKSAALQVLQAVSTDDFMLDLLDIIGLLPAKPKLFESDTAKQVPVMGRYMKTLKVAGENAMPRPVTVVWPQESSKIAQRVNESMAGKKAPADAMATLKEELNAIEQSA